MIILDQLCQSSLGNIKQNCYEDELESTSKANYITCHWLNKVLHLGSVKPRASPSHGVTSSVHLDFSSQLVFLTKRIVCAWPHPRGYLNTEDLIHFASSYSLWTWYLQNCCTILEVGERSHYLLIYIFNWPFPVRCETKHKFLNAF